MGIAYDRAWFHFQQHRYDHARKELAWELAADPENARAFALWALCDAECKNLLSARQRAEHAIRLNPAEPFAHYTLARVCLQEGFNLSGEESIREALRLRARVPDYLATLAEILYRQSQFHDAIETARQALAIDPRHATSHRVLALALRDAGESEAAKMHAAKALEAEPESALSHVVAAEVLRYTGDRADGEDHVMEAMRLDPNSPDARSRFLNSVRSSIVTGRIKAWILDRPIVRMVRKLSPNAQLSIFSLSLILPTGLAFLTALAMECRIELCMAAVAIVAFPWICIFGGWLFVDWMIQLHPAHRYLMSGWHRVICWSFVASIVVSYVGLPVALVLHEWELVQIAAMGSGAAICVMFASVFPNPWN